MFFFLFVVLFSSFAAFLIDTLMIFNMRTLWAAHFCQRNLVIFRGPSFWVRWNGLLLRTFLKFRCFICIWLCEVRVGHASFYRSRLLHAKCEYCHKSVTSVEFLIPAWSRGCCIFSLAGFLNLRPAVLSVGPMREISFLLTSLSLMYTQG